MAIAYEQVTDVMKKNKTDVLIVASTLDYGGAESVIYNIVRNIDRDRFNVHVLCLLRGGMTADRMLAEGMDVHILRRPERGLGKYMTFRSVLAVIRRLDIDVIHSHTTYGLIDCSIARMLNRRVRWVHTFHFGNYPHYRKRYMFLEKYFSRRADALVAVGHDQRAKLTELYRYREGRMEVIWNGVEHVNAPDEAFLDSLHLDGRIVIGTICRLTLQKGLPYLLEAAATMKRKGLGNFVFLVVGGGPLEAEIQQQRDELGLEDVVIFTGKYDNASAKILPRFDIFVQPSIWEAMSMVIIEAMAAAKPVVATDVGDNAAVLSGTGVIVEPRNPAALAEALEALLVDEGRRRSLGAAARARYQETCTVDRMVEFYAALYSDLVTGAGRGSSACVACDSVRRC